VLLVTGFGSEMTASIEKGLQVGAYAGLYKPFVTDELFKIMENLRMERLQAVLAESFFTMGA
jgi:two-component system, NtrC family, response regulator HydG